jgi:hypothetical protein
MLCLLVMTGSAMAEPLDLAVATHGSTLELTFTNTSKHALTMTTHVRAGIDHYDWLTVKLTAKAHAPAAAAMTRTLHFIETRTKAIRIDEDIAAGKSLAKSVDLVPWALREGNGDTPLAPGTYDVVATWDTMHETKGPKVTLVANTTLVIAAPTESLATPACNDSATTGLELLAHQVGTTATVELGVHNNDTKPHCIEGYIKTHEIQSDQLAIEFPEHPADKTPRRIELWDARDKSYPVYLELAPGATAWSTWNLADWASRKHGKPLPHATVWMTARYDGAHVRDAWRGALATSFGVRLP